MAKKLSDLKFEIGLLTDFIGGDVWDQFQAFCEFNSVSEENMYAVVEALEDFAKS